MTNIIAPRVGTKLSKLIVMLSRKSGVTISKASQALGWQWHTTRAALSNLKKRGYQVTRHKYKNKLSVYIITDGDK